MVKIRWLNEAKLDLREIYEYIAPDSKRYAKYQIEQIKESTKVLKSNPKLGQKVREFDEENLREIVYGRYRIIYRYVSDELIHVLLIHHGARELETRITK